MLRQNWSLSSEHAAVATLLMQISAVQIVLHVSATIFQLFACEPALQHFCCLVFYLFIMKIIHNNKTYKINIGLNVEGECK
jgi:hypothetical protein